MTLRDRMLKNNPLELDEKTLAVLRKHAASAPMATPVAPNVRNLTSPKRAEFLAAGRAAHPFVLQHSGSTRRAEVETKVANGIQALVAASGRTAAQEAGSGNDKGLTKPKQLVV